MIKTRIYEPDRNDLFRKELFEMRMRFDLRAKPVSGPEPIATPIEKRISGALETDFFIERI